MRSYQSRMGPYIKGKSVHICSKKEHYIKIRFMVLQTKVWERDLE